MAGDLIVRLAATEDDDCVWHDPEGTISDRGPLSAAAETAAGRRVHLLVPGADVLITRVAVPATQRARAQAAIPWALEDRLVDAVESLHFALGRYHDSGEWSVAVVARRTLDAWLKRCAIAGIEPVSARPEPLALPAPATDEWMALEEAGSVIVRTAEDGGFACDPQMLMVVAGAREKPGRIRRLGAAGAKTALLGGDFNVLADLTEQLSVASIRIPDGSPFVGKRVVAFHTERYGKPGVKQ